MYEMSIFLSPPEEDLHKTQGYERYKDTEQWYNVNRSFYAVNL